MSNQLPATFTTQQQLYQALHVARISPKEFDDEQLQSALRVADVKNLKWAAVDVLWAEYRMREALQAEHGQH
jgi:hypothetical protein